MKNATHNMAGVFEEQYPCATRYLEDASNWDYMLQDGLGSVRNDGMSYTPYGKPLASYGEGFGFTGEYTDANDLLYLRARYYAPEMGLFTALDPLKVWRSVP